MWVRFVLAGWDQHSPQAEISTTSALARELQQGSSVVVSRMMLCRSVCVCAHISSIVHRDLGGVGGGG